MFSKEVKDLLIQVISSWQVIAVSITLLLYLSLVFYVARMYHHPRAVSKSKPQKKKAEAAAPVQSEEADSADDEEPEQEEK